MRVKILHFQKGHFSPEFQKFCWDAPTNFIYPEVRTQGANDKIFESSDPGI